MNTLFVVAVVLFVVFVIGMVYSLCQIAGEADDAAEKLWRSLMDKEKDDDAGE